jgi:hypothetical protein
VLLGKKMYQNNYKNDTLEKIIISYRKDYSEIENNFKNISNWTNSIKNNNDLNEKYDSINSYFTYIDDNYEKTSKKLQKLNSKYKIKLEDTIFERVKNYKRIENFEMEMFQNEINNTNFILNARAIMNLNDELITILNKCDNFKNKGKIIFKDKQCEIEYLNILKKIDQILKETGINL